MLHFKAEFDKRNGQAIKSDLNDGIKNNIARALKKTQQQQQWNSSTSLSPTSCCVNTEVNAAAQGQTLLLVIYGTNKTSPSSLPVTSAARPPRGSLWHAGCWLMTPPGAARGTTHHLLQLLSLTTIFEFDGLSNYIPPLPCQLGGFAQLQIRML